MLKKNKLKIIILFTLICILFSSCGRGVVAKKDNEEDKLIVTTFYPLYVFTINVAKDVEGVKVENMTEPQTGCLHDYQLVPADLKTLEKADILVANGAGMESFISKVLDQLPNLKIIEAANGIPLLKDQDGHENPHVWVSVSGAISEVRNIAEGLAAVDPVNAEKYRANRDAYIKRLENLQARMKEELRDIRNRDIVTFHEAFPYFAQEFDLNIAAVIEREPGSEPSAGELAECIQTIKNSGIKVLFAEPQYSEKSARVIADETGAEIFILDPFVTGPNDAPYDSYERTMEENLKVLKEALK